MSSIDRTGQKFTLFFSSLVFLGGLHAAERCYRVGEWTIAWRGVTYTGGLAMFIIGAAVLGGGFFVVTSLRNLQRS